MAEYPFSSSPFPDPFSENPKPTPEPVPWQPVYSSSSFPEPEYPPPPPPSPPSQSPSSQQKLKEEESFQLEESSPEEFPSISNKNLLGAVIGLFILIFLFSIGVLFLFSGAPESGKKQEEQKNIPETLVIAANGGEISTVDGASIIIPAGALSKDTEIFIERIAAGKITDLYELRPKGLKFLKPVTVEIPYKGETAKNVVLEYWTEDNEIKRAFLKYKVDKKNRKLKTQVSVF